METNADKCNITVTGKWNPEIFSPTWVARTLFGKEAKDTINVEAFISPELSLRMISDNVIVFPKKEKLIIGVKQIDDQYILKAEEVMKNALTSLNHTPISAIGINFGFIERDINTYIYDLFETKDKDNIIDYGYDITGSCIQRSVNHGEWELILDLTLKDDTLEVLVNFHFDVNQALVAKEKIQDKSTEFKHKALDVLYNIYGLTLESSDNETEEGELKDDM